VVVADLVAAAAVAEAVALAAVAAMVAAATAVAVRSVADQQRINKPSAIGPSMVGNGPIIELHLSAAEFAVLGYPAPHSGTPHFERTGCQFGTHDFDHARFCHTRSFVDRLKRGSILPSHLNDRGDVAWTQRCGRFRQFRHAATGSGFNVGKTRDIIKSTCHSLQVQVKIAP